MTNALNHIDKLGFDKSCLENAAPEDLKGFEMARVLAVHKDSYTISDCENEVLAELVGKIIFSAASPIDYPAVGDWVVVNFYDEKKQYLDSRILKTGDVILLVSGGHDFLMLEDTEMIEVKQGPYAGEDDKECFEGIINDTC